MAQTLTPAHVQFLLDNGLRRLLRRDPSLPHQIVMLNVGTYLGVSCNCKRTRGDGRSLKGSSYNPIEVRLLWQPGEAITVWREHVAAAGEAIA